MSSNFVYIIPVGVVAACDDRLSVHDVGYDIGCGNNAARSPGR